MEYILREWNEHTVRFIGLSLLALFLLFGRFVSPRLWLRRDPDDSVEPPPAEHRQIQRPDGTLLHIELYGPAAGPPMVLTHGCGGDGKEFEYVKKSFADRYRLIIWDLPGMGKSGWPDTRDFSMEKMAADLAAVLELAGGRPAVLIGHSTGAMINLTFCRLFPELLGTRVAGLVLAHGTYTDVTRTLSPTWLMPYLGKPLLTPLCYFCIAASPLVWLLFKIGYLSGIAHWWIHLEMYARTESPDQLEFAASYVANVPVSAVARTNLAMFRFEETRTLRTINVPTLVVSGERDITTVPEASRRMAAEIENSQLVILAPARHLGIIERHREFHEHLNEWLDASKLTSSPHSPTDSRPA